MPANYWKTDLSPPRGLKVLARPLSPRHLPAVQAIEQNSFSQPWSPVLFKAELIHPKALPLCLLTLPAEMLVAYLILWLEAGEVQIQNLATHPAFLRQGLARYLLVTGLREAHARGAKAANLEVRPSNLAARRLYNSLGFSQVGRQPDYYQSDGEDAILLQCILED